MAIPAWFSVTEASVKISVCCGVLNKISLNRFLKRVGLEDFLGNWCSSRLIFIAMSQGREMQISVVMILSSSNFLYA